MKHVKSWMSSELALTMEINLSGLQDVRQIVKVCGKSVWMYYLNIVGEELPLR